uniref:PDZ domain-containing protein n=1 Tax=Anopheles quadriannulatus TaxID=34691 RepID=A0A182WWE9_ANOQN
MIFTIDPTAEGSGSLGETRRPAPLTTMPPHQTEPCGLTRHNLPRVGGVRVQFCHERIRNRQRHMRRRPRRHRSKTAHREAFAQLRDMANLITVRLQRGDGQAWGFRLQGGKDFSAPLVLQRSLRSGADQTPIIV